MLTAIAALVIASLVGGVFGSVATYTYVDSSEGKYCDRMGSVEPESDQNDDNDDEVNEKQSENKHSTAGEEH